jgi:hypothetical protein
MGYPPASVHGFPKKNTGIHEDLHGYIRAFSKKSSNRLSYHKCGQSNDRHRPIFGQSVDTPGLIIASTDPVAADSIGARLLGFLPQGVAYLYGLYKDKLGEADPKNMTMKGMDLVEAEKIFSKAAYGNKTSIVDREKIKNIHG